MLRFVTYALPLLILLLALFGFAVEVLDVEPTRGSVIKLALFDQAHVPAQLVFGAWLLEASGLLALFLLAQGRCGTWWLDGLVAGWLGWVFRGPLLVVTIVVAARQPHHAWWTLAFGWWVLYSVCGLALAVLARRTELDVAVGASGAVARQAKLAARRDADEAASPEVVEPVVAPESDAGLPNEPPLLDGPAPEENAAPPDELPDHAADADSTSESSEPERRRSPWAEPPGEAS